MEELIKILQETYKGLDASEEELFLIAHKLLYSKEANKERLNNNLLIEDEELELIEMKIGDFIEFSSNSELTPDVPIDLMNNFYVKTPSGVTRINKVVKKDIHELIEITFEDNTKQKVAKKHLYPQYNGVDMFADEVDYVITKNGKLKVKYKKEIKKDYVYDISIANPHLYYTSDGILSHNSAFMASQAANMVLAGNNILYLTLEMSEEETAKRIDANILDIDINEFKNTPITEIKEKFSKIKDHLGELIIKEYSAGTLNTLHIEGLLNELEATGFVPDAIFIDYIGLMASSRISLSAAGGTYGYIKSIAEECHGLAKKLDQRIITASQLNRGAYGNIDAGLESVSDSIGLVQTADVFYFIINSDTMKQNNQVLIKFEKNRNTGMLTSLLLEVDFPHMRYTDFIDENGNGYNQEAVNSMEVESFSDMGINTGIDTGGFNF